MSVVSPGWNAGTKSVGLAGLFPLHRSADWLGQAFAGIFIWTRQVKDLDAENARLRAMNERMSLEIQGLRETAHENDLLRSMVACKERLPVKTLSARVLSRDPSLWFQSIVVDKGSQQGIKAYMPVITGEGYVGQVADVSLFSSRVRLLMDPNTRLGVMFQNSRAEAVLEGNLVEGCELKYLARDAGAGPGDLVITSGLGGFCPKGIQVGKVTRINERSEELFLRATVIPCVSFSHLERVLIVLETADGAVEEAGP